MLFTLCRSCAAKLHIFETLLPSLGARPCVGCGTTVGYDRQTGKLVAPYTHIWQWWAWPIAWGIAMQDNYGSHVHEWTTTYWNGMTGETRQNCRCGASQTSAPVLRHREDQ